MMSLPDVSQRDGEASWINPGGERLPEKTTTTTPSGPRKEMIH